jgi:hypothetical protein
LVAGPLALVGLYLRMRVVGWTLLNTVAFYLMAAFPVSYLTTAVGFDNPTALLVMISTNLPPYADALRAATGRPVWDVTGLVGWLHPALRGS